MKFAAVILFAAAVFGLCYLADKGFAKLFRSQTQHKSGLSVRLNKRYASLGILMAVLGLASVFAGTQGWLIIAAGLLVMLVGIGLVVYYMTFGVFYDENGFVLTTFGRASTTYTYKDIAGQQLYNNQGHILVELHLHNGRILHLQGNMDGTYPFLDYAFERWCAQTDRNREDCAFYDPANSCWFPPVEEK